MGPNRLTSLDALRGVAALSVVVWHWQHFFAVGGDWQDGWRPDMQPFYGVLKPLYVQGWAAVDLFFVLSGFVFFWLYGAAIRERTTGAGHFAWLRFSRLYPLHFVMLIAAAVLQFFFFRAHGVFFVYEANDAAHFASSLFLVQAWWPDAPQSFDGPTWSVSIEIMLYVLFFAACRFGLKRGWHCLVVAALGGAMLFYDEHIGRGIIGFFMGGAMVAVWQRLRGHVRARPIAHGLGLVALAGWVALAAMLYRGSSWLAGGEGNPYFLCVFDFVLCPLTVLALALHEHARGKAYAGLGFLGDISYSTYLLHFPMQLTLAVIAGRLALTPQFFMQGWVMVAFYAVLIALGTLSYRFFERPLQTLLRNMSKRRVEA
ncbi:MAG TPA: acyltransferase [Rhizomicrobium sp.]|jgi:peptidoglycan/LPS O-acetylase OafA/YrhL|nr:acyltransferase [Rhizomicrobium sp.]